MMRGFGIVLNTALALGYLNFLVFLFHDIFKRPPRHFPWLTASLGGIFLVCGLHHVEHVLHMLAYNRTPGFGELAATSVQTAFSFVWLYLRWEAFLGKRGDRVVKRVPPALILPVWAIYSMYVIHLATGEWAGSGQRFSVMANIMLFALYTTIAWDLFKVQAPKKRWSLSGTTLAGYFYNCGLGHLVFGLYLAQGKYPDYDWHGMTIDAIALVPPILYLVLGSRREAE